MEKLTTEQREECIRDMQGALNTLDICIERLSQMEAEIDREVSDDSRHIAMQWASLEADQKRVRLTERAYMLRHDAILASGCLCDDKKDKGEALWAIKEKISALTEAWDADLLR
jgi:hypothetical protein